MPIQKLYFRVAVKKNLSVSDHLTRRKISSYCIPARDKWCAVIFDASKIKPATILEATGGFGLEVHSCTDEKVHLTLWHGHRKIFWILNDKERDEATYRPDMLKSLFNHLTSKRSEMQFLRELKFAELEENIKAIGKMPPMESFHAIAKYLDLHELEFPEFAEIDEHFENAASKNKQCYWVG